MKRKQIYVDDTINRIDKNKNRKFSGFCATYVPVPLIKHISNILKNMMNFAKHVLHR
jgi:hypothetical protein